MRHIGEFEGVNNIAAIENAVINDALSQQRELSATDIDGLKKLLISVMENNVEGKQADPYVREMAAHTLGTLLRMHFDRNIFDSFMRVYKSAEAKALPKADSRIAAIANLTLAEIANREVEHQFIKALLDYNPDIAIDEVASQITRIRNEQAIIIYSDALKESRALQEFARSFIVGGERKIVLINKSGLDNKALFDSLEIKGISDKNFDDIIIQQNPDAIVNTLVTKFNVKQMRIFALAEEDLAAWSRQKIVEALIMILKDKRFEIVSNYSELHRAYIKQHEEILRQA
jgi:hypothetical protein